jgi:hypothetical protein
MAADDHVRYGRGSKGPPPDGGIDPKQALSEFLRSALSPANTGEPWITPGEVAWHVREFRKRPCAVAEIKAALQGDGVPAQDVADAIVELRAQRRGYEPTSIELRDYRAEADRLRRAALAPPGSDPGQPPAGHRAGLVGHLLTHRLAWAAGIVAAALLTLAATAIVPAVARQFVSAPRIEDSIRRGPDIIVHAGQFYPAEEMPFPFVVSGNYHPSSQLMRTLADPFSIVKLTVQNRLMALHPIQLGRMFIKLQLRGNRNEQIQILDIRIARLHEAAPLNGVFFDVNPQGYVDNIRMAFNLDRPSPQAVTMLAGMAPTTTPYFVAHSINLSLGESQVAVIQVADDCTSAKFMLAIRYTVGGDAAKTEIVSNNGHPYQVTGFRWKGDEITYRQELDLQSDFSVITPSPSLIGLGNKYSPGDPRACPYDHY